MTLTPACEYATGNVSKASSATYLRYFMVNLPFVPLGDSLLRSNVATRRSLRSFSFPFLLKRLLTMRGEDEKQSAMFSYVTLERRCAAGSSLAGDPWDGGPGTGADRCRSGQVICGDGPPGAPLIAFFATSGMPRAFPLPQSDA